MHDYGWHCIIQMDKSYKAQEIFIAQRAFWLENIHKNNEAYLKELC